MTATFEPYERVRLATDRFAEQGVTRSAVGFVIERYDNGEYEVEICNPDGSTHALLTVGADDLERAEANES